MRSAWPGWLAWCLLAAGTNCGSSSRVLPSSTVDANLSLVDAATSDVPCTQTPGVPGEPCGCRGECVEGAQCRWVYGPSGDEWVKITICTAIASGTCFPGLNPDDRCTNGAFCLHSRAPDAPALCLTPDEKARLCAGVLASAFYCQIYGSKDADSWSDGEIP